MALGALVATAGCVGGSKGLSAEDKERLKDNILEAPPADVGQKLDVNFENKVHLIGFKAEPQPAKPGSTVKLTFYWRCDEPLDKDWKLFTHIEDDVPSKDKIGNLDFVGPIREEKNGNQLLGPDKWEKGKIYVDSQDYKLPDSVKGQTISVYTGIWKGDARLRIITGPNDGDNRAIAGKVSTGNPPPAPEKHTSTEPPILSVKKLAQNEKITIDGKADESAWGGAASTGPFVNVKTGASNKDFPVNGQAKIAWDDENLYFFFQVESKDLLLFTDKQKAPNDYTATGQPKDWTKDTVEMMIDPEGNGDNRDYYEIQVNPQNLVFKSQFDTRQQPNGGPNGPFGHEDWDPKMKSAAVINKDVGYNVEIAIPWAGFSKLQKKGPPSNGDSWRINLYAMKQNGGVSWSPIMEENSFHAAHRFGTVTFLVPGAAPAGSGSAAAGSASAPPAASGSAPNAAASAKQLAPRGLAPVHHPVLPPQ